MGLESSVSLVVAALDLQLVRLLRGAMRAADEQGHCKSAHLRPASKIEPRRHFHPEPVIEPRLHFRPDPVIEPRPVFRPDAPKCPPCCEVITVIAPAASTSSASPIQPPWKVLPWQDPPPISQPSQKVKVLIGSPDMCSKGNVIDLFI